MQVTYLTITPFQIHSLYTVNKISVHWSTLVLKYINPDTASGHGIGTGL